MPSSLLALSLALSLSVAPDQAARAAAPVRLAVSVTAEGFVVAAPRALQAGQPVTLVVTRSVERTCATDIVLKDFGISRPLPLNTPVEVTFVPKKKGKVHFSCAMDMVSGDLTVE
jgi:plastocyanin domain-containing protein